MQDNGGILIPSFYFLNNLIVVYSYPVAQYLQNLHKELEYGKMQGKGAQ
jgi:hypothetical protein